LVVKNLDETVKLMCAVFGAKEIGRKSFPEMGQTSCMVSIGGTNFELMEPLGTEGVIPKFLEKNGEGFHHISLTSDDLNQDCLNFEKWGIKLVDKSENIVFLHPKTSKGVLFEIEQGSDNQ